MPLESEAEAATARRKAKKVNFLTMSLPDFAASVPLFFGRNSQNIRHSKSLGAGIGSAHEPLRIFLELRQWSPELHIPCSADRSSVHSTPTLGRSPHTNELLFLETHCAFTDALPLKDALRSSFNRDRDDLVNFSHLECAVSGPAHEYSAWHTEPIFWHISFFLDALPRT
jgi:hypothetical protein